MEFSSSEVKKSMEHSLVSLGDYQSCSFALYNIHSIVEGSLNFVPFSCNNLANMITRDHRHQSYVVALHGPVWLASLIRQEASA